MLWSACACKRVQAVRNRIKAFVFLSVLALTSSKGMCSEWNALPQNNNQIAASFKNDDGGLLVVACDTTTKTISIRLDEPRAHWRTGVPMSWITKADAGAAFVPSNGIVIAPTQIIVKDQSKLDIQTMGQARSFFMVDVGHYSRIFPATNFKNAISSVLNACGEHWLQGS